MTDATMDGLLFAATSIPRHAPVGRRPQGRGRRFVVQDAPQWELDNAITVVLFAGLGGACQGLEEAGCPVHVASNHSDMAIAAHAAMHPHTKHIKGDIFDVDPVKATGGRRVKVLWASPDCKDHSVAKGGAPRSARLRSLPWQVCRWAGLTGPTVIFIENVREIRGWGPLVAKRDPVTGRVCRRDGTVAAKGEHVPVREQQLVRNKKRLGRSFRAFVEHLRTLGYAYDDRDLCCADYGVPTTRRRWFAVARRDGQPIKWPARTHAPAAECEALGLAPWVGAHTIIDWTLPIPSIFDRKKPLAEATNRRIAAGLKRYVFDNPTPFLLPITHSGAPRPQSLDEPLRTVTTAHRGEFALVAPYPAGCGGRAAQVLPQSIEEPIGAITTKGDRIVCAPSLTVFNENCIGVDVREPISTLTAGAPRFGVMALTLIQVGYGERTGQKPRYLNLQAPLGTVMAGGNKFALIAAWMAQHNFTVDKHVYGAGLDRPLSTVVTRSGPQTVAAAVLVKLRGQSNANDATEPLSTITSGGGHIAATAALLTKYYSQGSTDQSVADPLHTLSTKAHFNVVTAQIGGQVYAIADIEMRMIEPSEAAAAHELRLPREIVSNGVRRPLSKTEAMHLVGNSVPKRMARILAEANAAHALHSPTSWPLRAREEALSGVA